MSSPQSEGEYKNTIRDEGSSTDYKTLKITEELEQDGIGRIDGIGHNPKTATTTSAPAVPNND